MLAHARATPMAERPTVLSTEPCAMSARVATSLRLAVHGHDTGTFAMYGTAWASPMPMKLRLDCGKGGAEALAVCSNVLAISEGCCTLARFLTTRLAPLPSVGMAMCCRNLC